jgi:hypothetical protein
MVLFELGGACPNARRNSSSVRTRAGDYAKKRQEGVTTAAVGLDACSLLNQVE